MNVCPQHDHHDRTRVVCPVNDKDLTFEVYDWKKYSDVFGYCTGRDDISRTLINEKYWEKEETPLAIKFLANGDRDKVVVDIGCNVGWYSIIAGSLGYVVRAFDGDKENVGLTNTNAQLNDLLKVRAEFAWFDKDTPQIRKALPIAFFKSDIEGEDHNAIRVYQRSFEQQTVDSAMIEISPVMTKKHDNIIKQMEDWGYRVTDLVGDINRQANVFFTHD